MLRTPEHVLLLELSLWSILCLVLLSELLFNRYGMGNKTVVAPNPPYGALISYFVPEAAEKADEDESKDKKSKLSLEIRDGEGNAIFHYKKIPHKPGLHRVAWPLTHEAAKQFPENAARDVARHSRYSYQAR